MRITSFILIFSFLTSFTHSLPVLATEVVKHNIEELAFPNEIKDQPKSQGSIYYSPTVKNKVLVPVSMWGEVSKPGLHYVPVDSTLVKGLTLAGGPTGSGKLENVKLIRKDGSESKDFVFDLSKGGDGFSHEFVLKQGDVIFVQKDHFYENRTYYTSLIGVLVSIVSGSLLYMTFKDRN